MFLLEGNSKVLVKSNMEVMPYIILFADFTSFIYLMNSFRKTLLNACSCQVLSWATEHSGEQN